MDSDLLSQLPRPYKWFFGGVFVLVVTALLGASLMAAFQLGVGNISTASAYASVAGGLATVTLVSLTGWYALETRRLVKESEKAREEERKRRDEEHEREKDKLRRSLLNEIQAMENLDELAREYTPNHSLYRQLVPSDVYQSNTRDIGLLTPEEIEAVVEYYTMAEIVNDYLRVQRDRDTSQGRSIFEETYRALSLHRLFFRKQRKNRTKATAERIAQLAEAQEEAMQRLKANLEESDH